MARCSTRGLLALEVEVHPRLAGEALLAVGRCLAPGALGAPARAGSAAELVVDAGGARHVGLHDDIGLGEVGDHDEVSGAEVGCLDGEVGRRADGTAVGAVAEIRHHLRHAVALRANVARGAHLAAEAAVGRVGGEVVAGLVALRRRWRAELQALPVAAHRQLHQALRAAGAAVARVGLRVHALAVARGLARGAHAGAFGADEALAAGGAAGAAVLGVGLEVDAGTGAGGRERQRAAPQREASGVLAATSGEQHSGSEQQQRQLLHGRTPLRGSRFGRIRDSPVRSTTLFPHQTNVARNWFTMVYTPISRHAYAYL